jgi:predicted dithiol-disulfide oxidoreductase (DUF899 family)
LGRRNTDLDFDIGTFGPGRRDNPTPGPFGVLPDGSEIPAFNVFTRRDGTIRHFWSAEMTGSTADPGQDPRGAPDPAPVWALLDATPGRAGGGDWYPKLDYDT